MTPRRVIFHNRQTHYLVHHYDMLVVLLIKKYCRFRQETQLFVRLMLNNQTHSYVSPTFKQVMTSTYKSVLFFTVATAVSQQCSIVRLICTETNNY